MIKDKIAFAIVVPKRSIICFETIAVFEVTVPVVLTNEVSHECGPFKEAVTGYKMRRR